MMKPKKNSFLKNNILPKTSQFDFISTNNAKLLGFSEQENEQSPYVVLKYYQPDYECFSDWEKSELKEFSNFVEKLRKTNWNLIKAQSTKDKKNGLGYTQMDREKLPMKEKLNTISEDINFFELRVSQKSRVFGFRVNAAFFLVFLDRNHRICK